jgi:hypothetical protein
MPSNIATPPLEAQEIVKHFLRLMHHYALRAIAEDLP